MAWLEDFGYDLICEEQGRIQQLFLDAQGMTQKDLVEFFYIHRTNLLNLDYADKHKGYIELANRIIDIGFKSILSEKQKMILCNVYAHNFYRLCNEDHCNICVDTKETNKKKFMLSVKDNHLNLIDKIDKGTKSMKINYVVNNISKEDNYFSLIKSICESNIDWTKKQDYVIKRWIFENQIKGFKKC